MDYFTKWVEAEPMAKITALWVKAFLWKNFFYHFGLPSVIITDHNPQFDSHVVRDFCKEHGVDLRFSSVAHPQSNGQVENVNARILADLRRRLEDSKGRWAEALPLVL